MKRCRIWMAALLASLSTLAAASPLGPDGVAGERHPGKFVWFDLATEDPAAARAFYSAVFGWRFHPAPGAPAGYEIIEGAAGKVGGMFKRARPQGAAVGARWVSLMSVADAARAADYVKRNGGEIIVAPDTIAGRGTHAVFRDAQGAVFGVIAASGGDPADDPVLDGEIFWVDLFARAPESAAAFYAGLAGYDATQATTESGRTRWLLATGEVARAGIVPVPPGKSGPGWMPYVLVSDVGEAIRRALAAGGKVVVAPRADLLDRNIAVIADPLGGTIGIVNWVTRVEPLR